MTKTSHRVNKIEGALELLAEAADDKKQEIQDLLANKYKDLRETLQGAESSAVESAGEIATQARKKAHTVAAGIDEKAHDHPWRLLGWSTVAALLVGYVIGKKE